MALTTCRECNKPLSSDAAACPHCGAKPREKTGLFGWIGAIAIGIASLGLMSAILSPSTPRESPTNADVAETMQRQARAGLQLKSVKWTKAGFDNVLLASFVIVNKSKYRVRDVRVRCTTYGQSGTYLNLLDQVVYQTIMPSKSVAVTQMNMGLIHPQSRTASCDIADFSLL